jgi:hypothetical protein
MSMGHDEDAFLYTPLARAGVIRLLTLLHRRNANDNIECILSLVFLDDKPVYDALLYVWGEEMSTDPILVNSQPFQTTKNLKGA